MILNLIFSNFVPELLSRYDDRFLASGGVDTSRLFRRQNDGAPADGAGGGTGGERRTAAGGFLR